jgi:hypothetical protein
VLLIVSARLGRLARSLQEKRAAVKNAMSDFWVLVVLPPCNTLEKKERFRMLGRRFCHRTQFHFACSLVLTCRQVCTHAGYVHVQQDDFVVDHAETRQSLRGKRTYKNSLRVHVYQHPEPQELCSSILAAGNSKRGRAIRPSANLVRRRSPRTRATVPDKSPSG